MCGNVGKRRSASNAHGRVEHVLRRVGPLVKSIRALTPPRSSNPRARPAQRFPPGPGRRTERAPRPTSPLAPPPVTVTEGWPCVGVLVGTWRVVVFPPPAPHGGGRRSTMPGLARARPAAVRAGWRGGTGRGGAVRRRPGIVAWRAVILYN